MGPKTDIYLPHQSAVLTVGSVFGFKFHPIGQWSTRHYDRPENKKDQQVIATSIVCPAAILSAFNSY